MEIDKNWLKHRTLIASSETAKQNHLSTTVNQVTNLRNIYEFFNEMRHLLQSGETAWILMVGMNQFRHVNDVYGYLFGNQVLRSFAAMLTDFLAGKGEAYYMDGAKFALCIRTTDIADVEAIYSKIQLMARNGLVVEGNVIFLSVSGGALQVLPAISDEHVIYAALAYVLEISRRKQHSKLVFFENEKGYDSLQSLKLFATIRQNVLRGCQGFYLCYQPLVQSSDGTVIGMEALLRWSGEPYGDLLPGQFIHWLEQDECFFELGNWILWQAMLDGKQILEKQPDFFVNVNVSYVQLERNDFQEALLTILQETGFPPQNLYLELTERCRAQLPAQLQEVMEFFCAHGIKIVLDDFGMGTASLNLLREWPIDCLKIDRAFISNIQTNRTDEIIVEMVVNSANQLGMRVCLEGVENAQLCEYVKKYNADYHQGDFYSKPVPIEQFLQLLS